ncbi:MAG TPA: hypothetical protein VIJ72_02545 [Rhizomicrobium sp.]
MENKETARRHRAAQLHALAARLRAEADAATMPGYAEKMRRTAQELEAKALLLEEV